MVVFLAALVLAATGAPAKPRVKKPSFPAPAAQ